MPLCVRRSTGHAFEGVWEKAILSATSVVIVDVSPLRTAIVRESRLTVQTLRAVPQIHSFLLPW